MTRELLKTLALLAAAGAAGTLARHGLNLACEKWLPGIHLGTLAVNVLGCLLFGLVWGLGEDPLRVSPQMRLVILTGFMGAFTTFSSFAFGTCEFARQGQWWLAGANIAANNVMGIVAFVSGVALGKLA